MKKIDNEKINDLIEENKKLKEDLLYEKNFWNENNRINHHLYRELEILLNNKRELIKVLIKKAEKLQQENQQLKEEIKQLKFDCAMFKSANYLINDVGIDRAREVMFQTEKKLKQSQNSKAIEVLWKLKKDLFDNSVIINIMEHRAIRLCNIFKVIDNQITKLRGDKHE